nr:hypothetical protein BaRGS_004747 [Batillaria attramentaria]
MDLELLDLEGLTTEERTIILNVMRRDEELRQRQDNRISQLKWLTGDWLPKDKKQNSQVNATDLVRASLRVKHSNELLSVNMKMELSCVLSATVMHQRTGAWRVVLDAGFLRIFFSMTMAALALPILAVMSRSAAGT